MNTTINIRGMTCGHCVKRVEKALRDVTGVTSVNVNLELENVVVGHNSSVEASELITAVFEAGYEATKQEP